MNQIAVEVARRRAFAWSLEWPGWCRAGRDEGQAVELLAAYAARYRRVAALAGEAFDEEQETAFRVAEHLAGSSGTEFGVPSAISDADRQPTTRAQAERLARLVGAAWSVFDGVAAAAPADLRKGPRGGGRDTAKMVVHVLEADREYSRLLGLRIRTPAADNRVAIEAMRAQMLDVLRQPSDGSPLAGRRWPQRYAARYIAWHALDHAWEIEDRTE